MRLYVRTSRDTKCERGAGGVCTWDARCETAAGGRGCLGVAGRTDALHASLSSRNAGCGSQDLEAHLA